MIDYVLYNYIKDCLPDELGEEDSLWDVVYDFIYVHKLAIKAILDDD